MMVMTSCVSIPLAELSACTWSTCPRQGRAMPTTTAEVARLRAWPALTSGPGVLVAVLAIVIIVLAAGLAVVLITGQDAGAMP